MKTIEMLETERKNALAPYYEIQEDRMKRYFDCQDDTIFGGISDQVTSATISKINRHFDIAIEQLKNNGFLIRTEKSICLMKNGNIISDKICKGRFGYVFVLKDGTFVGVAKKKSTFDKKGYEVKIVETEYKCKFARISEKGHVIYKEIEEVKKTMVDFDFNNDVFNVSYNWISYLKDNQ